jgi:glycosyltransferase involved in cell wall biosynthesis
MLVTVAICTYRRFDWLHKCLDALTKQSLPDKDFEIIVVDNSLEFEKSEKFQASKNEITNLKYLIAERSGLSYSRNVALEACRTPYIAYIDDDALADFFWIQSILNCFERYQGSAGIVGGPVRPLWEIPKPAWLEGHLQDPLAIVDWGCNEFVIPKEEKSRWLVGANISYDAKALRKVGGFPENLGRKQDLLLCHEELAVNNAIRDMGYKMVYCPDASVNHLVQKERLSFEWLCIDTFWETVSYTIYASGETGDFLTPQIKRSLNAALPQLVEKSSQQESQRVLEKERERFRMAARRAMEPYNFYPKKSANVAPCIYIVTPCLNAGHFIDICIESVVSQAGDFYIRYHIQDGGSDDATLRKLATWKEKIDSGLHPLFCRGVTFTYQSAPDDSMYDAIAKGFRYLNVPEDASMTWINADDYLVPGALATVQKVFGMSSELSWIIGPIHSCTGKSYPIGHYFFAFPLPIIMNGLCDGHHWQHIQQEGTFWRGHLWDRVGGLDLSFRYAADWDLWRRFARHSRPIHTRWALGCFRKWPNQLSAGHMTQYNTEIESRLSFDQREKAFGRLKKEKMQIQLLSGTSDKEYKIQETFLRPEWIPECTRKNYPTSSETWTSQYHK